MTSQKNEAREAGGQEDIAKNKYDGNDNKDGNKR